MVREENSKSTHIELKPVHVEYGTQNTVYVVNIIAQESRLTRKANVIYKGHVRTRNESHVLPRPCSKAKKKTFENSMPKEDLNSFPHLSD